MLFKLRDVFVSPDTSKRLEYCLDLSSLSLNGGYPFGSPVSVTARALNKAGLVKLYLDVDFTYFSSCDRCGTDMEKNFKFSFNHVLVVSHSGDSDGEYIETPDYELELDDLVTADILLELPSKLLCREDCKGLCPVCGKNLNEGECNCSRKQVDPRLEVLKKLLD